MRGFLASALGTVLLLLLFYAYLPWNAVKDLDRAITEYAVATADVKDRSLLEIRLWKTLKDELSTCNALVASGKRTVIGCNDILNDTVLAFASSHDLVTCPEPVVYAPPILRFVCPVEGWVGKAKFLVPVGAEVGP